SDSSSRRYGAVVMRVAARRGYAGAIRGFAVAVGEQERVVFAGCRNLAANFDGRALVLNQFAEHSLTVGRDVDESVDFHLLEPERITRPERRHTADLRLGEDVAPIICGVGLKSTIEMSPQVLGDCRLESHSED